LLRYRGKYRVSPIQMQGKKCVISRNSDFCAQTLRRRVLGVVGYVPGRGGSELTETNNQLNSFSLTNPYPGLRRPQYYHHHKSPFPVSPYPPQPHDCLAEDRPFTRPRQILTQPREDAPLCLPFLTQSSTPAYAMSTRWPELSPVELENIMILKRHF